MILNEHLEMLDIAKAALDAGVTVLQYRAKLGIVPEHLRALRLLTSESDALLIVNDDWRAAKTFDCDGAHLGPGDSGFSDVAEVRFNLPDALVGLSCGTIEEITKANAADVDYLGIGSVFPTASKADAGAPIGIDGLRTLAAQTYLPVAAIGGITPRNVEEVRATGVAMAAVISAVAAARDPRGAASELVAAWGDGIRGES
ncbi:MAG TPA: thiamine phosphate synthase [Candidatus Baltobacteraceae bacterium]|nr:thiamine phosphate synthase [Candidatus Baltobacteraceae bacterium]